MLTSGEKNFKRYIIHTFKELKEHMLKYKKYAKTNEQVKKISTVKCKLFKNRKMK